MKYEISGTVMQTLSIDLSIVGASVLGGSLGGILGNKDD
jgi:hypothetical protein